MRGHAELLLGRDNMDRDLLIRRNNLEVNKLAAQSLRVAMLFLVALWLFTTTGYYECDQYICAMVFVTSLMLLSIPTILNLMHFEKQSMKYFIILCIMSVVMLLSIFISYNFMVLLVMPLLIATMYCDRSLIFATSFIDCICLFVTMLIRYYFFKSSVIAVYGSLTGGLVYGAFLKMFLILVATLFANYIVERNMVMLNKTIEANADLFHNQEELIYAFAEISESKSKVTGEHIRRVAEYMRILGKASGFTDDYVKKLAVASMMHDIGKLMIPEEILDKPARLTDEEYAIMKNHVLYGEALLAKCPGEIMQIAKTIALQHHEKWDGTGYLGMKGNEIAYVSRLMALCDVFDALTSQRYYKEGWSIEDTYKEIVRSKGTHFDPDVVELFEKNYDEFQRVLNAIPDKGIY